MKISVITIDNQPAGEIELDDSVFNVEVREDILHRMVVWQLAKRRAGTHKVKNRAEINRTSKKIGRQKGGGTARHGSGRVGQFRGGGRAFGPLVRSHAHDLTKKFRAIALRMALSTKMKDGKLVIIDDVAIANNKTKTMISNLNALGVVNGLIIGGAELPVNTVQAVANVKNIDLLPVQGCNVYDILRRDRLLLSKSAVDSLSARLTQAKKEAL